MSIVVPASAGRLRLKAVLRAVLVLAFLPIAGLAEEPSVSYIFPAGGQRGTAVSFRIGGHFLFTGAPFEMLGPGVEADPRIERTETIWFEGPVIPLPASQAQENYPKDYAGSVRIAADASLGLRYWRVWTSQGTTPAMKFVVGDLPEIVEQEVDGDPLPVPVQLPVTINGRLFPREDVDRWSFDCRAGETIAAEVVAARIGSPVDSELEVLDPQGRVIAENADYFGADSFVRFTAPIAGRYEVRIHDAAFGGLQHYVYRLTLSAAPRVDGTYPLGGRRGTATRFELAGHGLPADPVETLLPADGPRDFACRLPIGDRETNPFLLELDDLPECLETEPNDDAAQAAVQAVPAVLNGRIGTPGDGDVWAFAAKQGENFDLDVRAARLGSPLDSVLVLSDSDGKELARADDIADGQTDSRLAFTSPADGVYRARVEERFASRGGPRFAYRLRIDRPPAADFRLSLVTDAVTIARGAAAKLPVNVERLGGFNEAVQLAIDGLPQGVTATDTAIAAGAAATQVTLTADKAATIQSARVTVRGVAKIGDQEVSRTAAMPAPRGELALDSVRLAVALPTPFKIKAEYVVAFAARGTTYRRHYTIDRGGFEGPLTVALADRQARHLQGVTGPEIIVPAGATEFDYSVYMPPWMEVGRTSRSVVMGWGELVDADGSRHTVSFSSQQQNEQIVMLVDPGPLGVQAESSSILAAADKSIDLALRLQRGRAVAGPVRLELVVPRHIQGVVCEPVTVPAGGDRGALAIRFLPGAGPFNMPLVVRASGAMADGPVVAETRLEVVAAP